MRPVPASLVLLHLYNLYRQQEDSYMCGIVGYSGGQDACGRLMHALSCLEYRGYDSAGVAVVGSGGLALKRAKLMA